jgi:hypothetical protein
VESMKAKSSMMTLGNIGDRRGRVSMIPMLKGVEHNASRRRIPMVPKALNTPHHSIADEDIGRDDSMMAPRR